MGSDSVNGSALQTLLFLHGHYQLGGFPLTERAEEKSLGAVQTCQHCRAGNLGMHHSPSQAPGDRREAGLKGTWAKGQVPGAPAAPHTRAPARQGGSWCSWTKAFYHPGAFRGEPLSCTNSPEESQSWPSLLAHLPPPPPGLQQPRVHQPSACFLFIYLVKMSLGRFMFRPFAPLREEIMEDLAGDAHTHQPRGAHTTLEGSLGGDHTGINKCLSALHP